MTRLRSIVLIAILVYLATGIAQIRPDERGVVRRFGKIVARPGPGLWVGYPWGIDRLDRVSVKSVRQLSIGESDDGSSRYLTGDQNLVTARLIVEYAVDPRDSGLDLFIAQRDKADSILTRETEAMASEWIAAQSVDDLLLNGRSILAARLFESLPARLAVHRLGIVLQRVSVESLAPPEEVRESFERVNQSQTEMVTKENQARQDADRRLREAEGSRFRFETQAESYRIERDAIARADAASFLTRLEQYRKLKEVNPDILQAIWWDETGRLLLGMKGRGRIDLLDSHIGKDGLDISQFLPHKK